MIRRSWMMGASIEATLELWASSLRDVKGRMRPLFTQERGAASAGSFLDGLLGAEQRKTGWRRAEAAGDRGPWRQQAILGRGRWDADALRDIGYWGHHTEEFGRDPHDPLDHPGGDDRGETGEFDPDVDDDGLYPEQNDE